MQEISTSDAHPSITRDSDCAGDQLLFATRKVWRIVVGKGPGPAVRPEEVDTSYIRDYLLDRGAAADVRHLEFT